jgi:hypothetical protein
VDTVAGVNAAVGALLGGGPGAAGAGRPARRAVDALPGCTVAAEDRPTLVTSSASRWMNAVLQNPAGRRPDSGFEVEAPGYRRVPQPDPEMLLHMPAPMP